MISNERLMAIRDLLRPGRVASLGMSRDSQCGGDMVKKKRPLHMLLVGMLSGSDSMENSMEALKGLD